MKKYNGKFSTMEYVQNITKDRKPDFNNIIKALKLETPDRPTNMELFLNNDLYEDVTGEKCPSDFIERNQFIIRAFRALGYDYATINTPPDLYFESVEVDVKDTKSLNHKAVIYDEKSFNDYRWPNAKDYDYSYLLPENLKLIDGMKAVCIGPGGELENLISLLGYDNLCIMIYENPEVVKMIADKIGGILCDYYENCVKYDTVGTCYVNDDWGFKTQTMLSPKHMREYIIPWHKKMTEIIHAGNKYAIMHSCGMPWEVMDDIIYDIKSDAKHSFEDNITPVEQAYEKMKNKIAVVGGIDINFLCTKTPKEVYDRAVSLLKQTKKDGGYLLGSGNSIPEYIPRESLFAMLSAALNES